MSRRSRSPFASVKAEGGLLPVDILQRIAREDRELPLLDAESYHLDPGRSVGDAIAEAWARLQPLHARWATARDALPSGDAGTTHTRKNWLLPLFDALGYGRLRTARAIEVEGREFAISHGWDASPIHLLSFRLDLDKRVQGTRGASTSSPHGLLQDALNRSDDHLWGFVSNGRTLRILRDHHSLTRMAYVEFDLDLMFGDELFADFRLLWLLAHESRLVRRPTEAEGADVPEGCVLELWHQAAAKQGVQALDQLRDGVEAALNALGAGFLRHPANQPLRDALASGRLSTRRYYRQLLRLAYRFIFLFVAEERHVLLDPSAPAAARRRYLDHYSTSRIRELAATRRGTGHSDLWAQLKVVMGLLQDGYPDLALPALGSFLWSPEALGELAHTKLANTDLLSAIRAMDTVSDGFSRRSVAWHLVAAGELGGIYESLMELHPVIEKDSRRSPFVLKTAAGHARKTTGSYYTPDSLVQRLLDTALDPVLDRAMNAPDPERAILELRVVDPACGSGHFLVAAARRMADRLARVRTGDAQPAPPDLRRALRDVVGRCIYGVDLNEMAVELCKVALWMEAIEPGRPLSFLDAHIQHGNALLGATPALLEAGIPHDAWKPLTGDDKEVAKKLRSQNRREEKAGGQGDMFASYVAESAVKWDTLTGRVARVESEHDQTVAGVRAKERAWAQLQGAGDWSARRFVADLWCAAFVWRKTETWADRAPTWEAFRRWQQDPSSCPGAVRTEVERLAGKYHFFHWHLAFPAVFAKARGAASEGTGWQGGFDVVLGNPPWERIKLQEKEWFATRDPQVAGARNAAARKKAIAKLEADDPALFDDWIEALREAEGQSRFVRDSGRYPLCGRGDVNTYSIFSELNRGLLGTTARAGFIVPSGIATDATTQYYFRDIVETRQLAAFHSFENEEFIFPAVHNQMKFAIVTLTSVDAPSAQADLVFFARQAHHLDDEQRHFTLSAKDFALINPNTMNCPTFRTRRDAEITKGIYRRVPALWRENAPDGNPWGLSFRAMLHMANDSGLFRTREDLEAEGWRLRGNVFEREDERMLPLYEAKMVHHYDHRYAGLVDGEPGNRPSRKFVGWYGADVSDPEDVPIPRYWVAEGEVEDRLEGRWDRGWLLGWRDVTNSVNQRTTISCVVPRRAANDKLLLALPQAPEHLALAACLNSYVLDYVCRQKLGGMALKYFVMRQLPVPRPSQFATSPRWNHNRVVDWLRPRVLELTYTAWDLEAFAQDHGHDGPPFRWDEDRRFQLRAELDAAMFHLYGVARDDVDHIMESFWLVKKDDEKTHGTYRTKHAILAIYDAMQAAIDSGTPYESPLDPPPAHPSLCHPPRGEG